MTDTPLDYDSLVGGALRGVMVEALRHAERHGLSGGHHFYITFRTDHPGTVLADPLKARFPEEITIVLQHQFWDLEVGEAEFRVTLSFNQSPHTLTVPFEAVTTFVDPSVKFGLSFQPSRHAPGGEAGSGAAVAATEDAEEPQAGANNIVALDRFRKS